MQHRHAGLCVGLHGWKALCWGPDDSDAQDEDALLFGGGMEAECLKVAEEDGELVAALTVLAGVL